MEFNLNFWEMFKDFLIVLWLLWPIWVFAILLLVIKIMLGVVLPKKLRNLWKFKKREKWRSDHNELARIRGLSPKEFEDYIADLFNRLGYRAHAVGGPNDKGIDVIAEKDGRKHYIQCKKYFKAGKVGLEEVRSFYGAIVSEMANGKSFFITTSKFTLPAEQFADDKPIELVDGIGLLKYIKLAKSKEERK